MDLTSYQELIKETEVQPIDNGLAIFCPRKWVIASENRVSYTTIIRLVECCREFHWYRDVENIKDVDSTCKNINAQFFAPIIADSTVVIKFKLRYIFANKYVLDFFVYDKNNQLCCIASLESYFLNHAGKKRVLSREELKSFTKRLNWVE